jgi:hypothetical protein
LYRVSLSLYQPHPQPPPPPMMMMMTTALDQRLSW